MLDSWLIYIKRRRNFLVVDDTEGLDVRSCSQCVMVRDDAKQYAADATREPLVCASSMVVPPRLGDPLVMSYLATSSAVSLSGKGECELASSGNFVPGAHVKTGRNVSRPSVRERLV